MSALKGRSQDALLYALALAIETTPIGACERSFAASDRHCLSAATIEAVGALVLPARLHSIPNFLSQWSWSLNICFGLSIPVTIRPSPWPNPPLVEMLSSHTICSFLYLISLTTAAQISPSKSGTTYRTLALPSILVRPADNAQYYCTTSPSWVNATWNPADCLGANQLVQDVELVPRRNTVYEFIEAGARQLSPTFYGQATPRKYIYGRSSCLRPTI